ncbi:MAG: biotin--[acetyl-CoA-carboxylase] ligase, partial [Spirochaetales bacterium]|nr:biotin--[acetyl-CoA-carboxylase] ligase [Spirochaetales bacterium]
GEGRSRVTGEGRSRVTGEGRSRVTGESTSHGTVIVAGFQEEGRGRLPGRRWYAEPDHNLLCTIIFSVSLVPFPLMRLPLLIGGAVALLCERDYGVDTGIKWPNDILAGGKKIAGILCESEKGYIYAGIGINCNQERFGSLIDARSTSLRNITGRSIDVFSLCEALLFRIKAMLEEKEWKNAIERRLLFRGKQVRVVRHHTGGETSKNNVVCAEGIVNGIGDEGALLLSTGASGRNGPPLRIISGELVEMQYDKEVL